MEAKYLICYHFLFLLCVSFFINEGIKKEELISLHFKANFLLETKEENKCCVNY